MPQLILTRGVLTRARLPLPFARLEDDLARAMVLLAPLNGSLATWSADPAASLVATGPARYQTGPWAGSQGILVEEARTNHNKYPSFEPDLTGWSVSDNGGAAGGTAASSAVQTKSGAASCLITVAAQNKRVLRDLALTLTAGTTYTISAWAYIQSWTSGTPGFRTAGSGFVAAANANPNTALVGIWQRVSAQVTTVNDLAAKNCYVKCEPDYTGNNCTSVIYWDALQFEAGTYTTTYMDGSLGTGYTWQAGTPPNTKSDRAATTLSLRSTTVSPQRGAALLYVCPESTTGRDVAPYLLALESSNGNPSFRLLHNASGTVTLRVFNGASLDSPAGDTPAANTWTPVYADWQPGLQRWQVGAAGALRTATLPPIDFTGPTYVYAASGNTGALQPNDAIAGLMLFSRPLTADERTYLMALARQPNWQEV